MSETLIKCIEELLEHKSRQIDENRFVSKHFDELEKRLIKIESQLSALKIHVDAMKTLNP